MDGAHCRRYRDWTVPKGDDQQLRSCFPSAVSDFRWLSWSRWLATPQPIRPVRRRCLTRPPLGLRTRPGRLTRGQQLRPAGHQEGQSKAWQDYGQSKRIPIRRLISALSAYRRSGEDELICISKHRSVPLVTAVAAACCMCLSVKELTGAAELVFASMLRQAWRSF